ncbi:MAG: PTS transporter subunit EIIB [bacterium]
MENVLQYLVIALLLAFIVLIISKLSKKGFEIEANKLLTYLGGKDNIVNIEVNSSRLKVILKDISLADKDGIQKLGAKGVVEIDNQLKIIFDKKARTLKRYIEEII